MLKLQVQDPTVHTQVDSHTAVSLLFYLNVLC